MAKVNRRALLVKGNAPLELVEEDIPPPPPRGLIVKTHYAGICHSDVHLWQDDRKPPEPGTLPTNWLSYDLPICLGHEIAGEVHSIGSEKNEDDHDIRVGDKVMVFPWCSCNGCNICRAGDENLCLLSGKFNLGVSQVGGGYQQYVTLADRKFVIKVPDALSMEIATMLPCSGLTTYHAVKEVQPTIERFAKIEGKAVLLIIGAGGLGQWAVQIAKAVLPSCTKIISADISAERVAGGTRAGADATVVWPIGGDEDEILLLTKKVAAGEIHAVIDLVNNDITISRAFQLATPGGKTIQVGLFGGTARKLQLGLLPIKAVSITGIYVGNYRQLQELTKLASEKKLIPPNIIKVGLEEATDYLMRLRDGKVNGRALIDFIEK